MENKISREVAKNAKRKILPKNPMMTFWEKITTAMVMDRFNAGEATIFKGLGGGQDQLSALLADTVINVQGKIKAGGGQLPGDCYTPKSLRNEVVSIVIWDWITGFSANEKLQTKERKAKYDAAMKVLDAVAAGERKVELLDVGQSDTVGAPRNAVSVVRTGRRTRNHEFDGGLT